MIRTTARIFGRIIIALSIYMLFNAESLAESWKQSGVPSMLADTAVNIGRKTGMVPLQARIAAYKNSYHDPDILALLSDFSGKARPHHHDPSGSTGAKSIPDQDISGLGSAEAPSSGKDLSAGKEDAKPSQEETRPLHAEAKPTPPQGTEKLPDPSEKTEGSLKPAQTQNPSHDLDIPQPARTEADQNIKAPENGLQAEVPLQQPVPTENSTGSPSRSGRNEPSPSLETQPEENTPDKEKLPSEKQDASLTGDILYLPFYAEHEPPALEHIHRTVQKSMFEKKLTGEYTVLLIGDSFMEEATLTIMHNSYYKKSGLKFHSLARFSTGLTSTKKWNWQKKLEEGILKYNPDIVLILLGANDLTGIVEEKKVYPYKSEIWMQKYGERAEALIDTALRHNVVPIWIGLPVMIQEPFLTGIPLISSMQKQACINKNIIYVDTLKTLADENGGFVTYKKDENGKNIQLRKKDKCHIAADGMLLVMDEVIPFIRRYVEYKEMLCHADKTEKTSTN